jgi:hypothetical protein
MILAVKRPPLNENAREKFNRPQKDLRAAWLVEVLRSNAVSFGVENNIAEIRSEIQFLNAFFCVFATLRETIRLCNRRKNTPII